MSKVKDKSDKSHKVGVKKPDGWKAPDFTDILKDK